MKVITVGRHPDNDKVVEVGNNDVSRYHLEIIQDDSGNFTLVDHSLNGTSVNGQIVKGREMPLSRTDIVRVGNTTLPWRRYFEETNNANEGSSTTMVAPKKEKKPKKKINIGRYVWPIIMMIIMMIVMMLARQYIMPLFDRSGANPSGKEKSIKE